MLTQRFTYLIKERDKLLLEFERSNQKSSYEQFSKIRNLIQNKVKKAKNSFYNNKVEQCKGSSSQLWKSWESIGLSKGTPGSSKIDLSEGEEIIFENFKVANIFTNFFTLVTEKLVNKLPERPIHLAKQFLKDCHQKKGVVENSFHFSTVSENLLNGLTASKATGMDSLPARFLKDGAEVIAFPLSHIINLSLHSNQIPEDMKNARVVPLYKNVVKLSLETIDLFPFSVLLPKFLRE